MTFLPSKNPDEDAGSHYVDRRTARRAVELAAPLIESGRGDPNIVGSGFLYVVVMDPGLLPGQVPFEAAILHEQAFGDRQRWDADYAAFARAKAQTSWRSGMASHRLQHELPHLLRTGDSLLAGGVWLDGIVVGISGAFPHYDEVYATTIACFVRALAREARLVEPERPTLLAPAELIRT